MKQTLLQLKRKKKTFKSPSTKPWKTFSMELKGKLGQSSVNGLPNNSSSVNPLPRPDIMEVDSLRGKMFCWDNQSRWPLS